MIIEKRLQDLGINVPDSSAPKAMYIPVRQTGNLLFISGQVPFAGDSLLHSGHVGKEVTLEEAQDCAKLCAINILAVLKSHLGDLDRVKSVVKVQAFVSSAEGFNQQHIVTNAASQLLFDVFGEAGRHARTAVGTSELPLNAPVEVEAIIEVA